MESFIRPIFCSFRLHLLIICLNLIFNQSKKIIILIIKKDSDFNLILNNEIGLYIILNLTKIKYFKMEVLSFKYFGLIFEIQIQVKLLEIWFRFDYIKINQIMYLQNKSWDLKMYFYFEKLMIKIIFKITSAKV